MGEATVVTDGDKFRRWTFKVDNFLLSDHLQRQQQD